MELMGHFMQSEMMIKQYTAGGEQEVRISNILQINFLTSKYLNWSKIIGLQILFYLLQTNSLKITQVDLARIYGQILTQEIPFLFMKHLTTTMSVVSLQKKLEN